MLLPNDQPRDRCVPLPANCAPDKPAVSYWRPPPLILEHFKLRRWLFLGAGRSVIKPCCGANASSTEAS